MISATDITSEEEENNCQMFSAIFTLNILSVFFVFLLSHEGIIYHNETETKIYISMCLFSYKLSQSQMNLKKLMQMVTLLHNLLNARL